MSGAKQFAAMCLALVLVSAVGYLLSEQLAAARWRSQVPGDASDQQLATSALTDNAFPAETPPVETGRSAEGRVRCAKVEIAESGSLIFRAQCPVGKTRCPWVSVGEEALRVSGGYLPAQTFPVGPETTVTCEEIKGNGERVERTLVPTNPLQDRL